MVPAEIGEKTMSQMIDKAWKVINSCETPRQAGFAMRYLDLLSEKHPELDVSPLRKELITLFELRG